MRPLPSIGTATASPTTSTGHVRSSASSGGWRSGARLPRAPVGPRFAKPRTEPQARYLRRGRRGAGVLRLLHDRRSGPDAEALRVVLLRRRRRLLRPPVRRRGDGHPRPPRDRRPRVLPRGPVRLRLARGPVAHGRHRRLDGGRGLLRRERQPPVPGHEPAQPTRATGTPWTSTTPIPARRERASSTASGSSGATSPSGSNPRSSATSGGSSTAGPARPTSTRSRPSPPPSRGAARTSRTSCPISASPTSHPRTATGRGRGTRHRGPPSPFRSGRAAWRGHSFPCRSSRTTTTSSPRAAFSPRAPSSSSLSSSRRR